ncbi:MAG: hypothetical protein ACP5NC_01285 [Nitrososphaeria archaeon]
MSEVNVDKFVSRAKSFGLNVFFGSLNSRFFPQAFWDEDQGDYVKFLKLAKDSGASMVIIDKYVIDDDEINENMIDTESISDDETLRRAKELNGRLESFRQYNGKIAGANISWIKDGVSFSYAEYAPWATEFLDLIDEIELEFGS